MLCLPKSERTKLSRALRDGDISIEKLYGMTSSERNAMFAHYVGDTFARDVNAKFEQAMLSTQKKAIANWIEKTTTAQGPIRRDLLKRVERVKKVLTPDEEYGFLTDLVETKMGVRITEEEAKTILKLKEEVDRTREAIPESYVNREDTPPMKDRPTEAIAYGYARAAFKNYTQGLKEKADELTLEERFNIENFGKNILDLAGLTKSLKGSLDNSFMGRQGLGVLLRGNVNLWAKNFVESFKTFGKELKSADKDTSVMDAITADILSRPNALNGVYDAAPNRYGLDVLTEEMYPSLDPQRIPLLGKAFKASATAFNGTAMQLRADLADALIAQAQKNGIDVMDPREARGLGLRVASLTGRGELETFAPVGDKINLLMFAPRFLRSRFNILTGGQFYSKLTPYARKEAALDTLRIAMGIGTLLSTAKVLGFDVESDPRSAKFGQICYGNRCMDTTGGIRGLATLASRIVPTQHNGEWGAWSKSGSTGKYTRLNQGEYGESTALDYIEQFFEGKLSPGLGVARDILKGQTYSGEKVGFENPLETAVIAGRSLVVPIPVENAWKNFQKGDDGQVLAAMADALGFSTSDKTLFPSGKRWSELLDKEGAKIQNDAINEVTERFNARVQKLEESPQWEKMTNEKQSDAIDKIKREETDRVLKRYGL